MNLDLKGYRLSLIFAPADMRSGFSKLSAMAKLCANIDVEQRRDCVVFVSRSRYIAKIIWVDDKGCTMLTRKLHEGSFQQLVARIDEGEEMTLTKELLMKYLDGEDIQSKRTDFLQGC